jgi:predicted porin
MKDLPMKSIVPAALLLSLASAAHAEFTVYGLLDASYGKSVADGAKSLSADFHSGGDDGSGEGNSTTKFGLKGSTEVAPGVKANFDLQSNGITSDGEVNSPFFGRQAWLGLSGSLGEVRLGKQDSVAFQTMIGYDFNGASNGIAALGYAKVGPWQTDRVDRSLQYISPVFGGVKAQVAFQPAKATDATTKANAAVGVTYATGPVSASAVYESKRTKTGDPFASIAGSYDFGVAKVMTSFAKSGTALKGVGLGVVVPVAGASVGAMFGKNTGTIKGKAYEIFANKEVFKSTIAYIEYGHANAKAINGLAFPGVPTGTAGSGYALGVIYLF